MLADFVRSLSRSDKEDAFNVAVLCSLVDMGGQIAREVLLELLVRVFARRLDGADIRFRIGTLVQVEACNGAQLCPFEAQEAGFSPSATT